MLKRWNINGSEQQVWDAGHGVPILLVHGFPLDHQMWKHQTEYFQSNYRVIVPDLRGFGGSESADEKTTMAQFADDLALLLNELKVNEPVVYCGLSMGGYIGWQFYRRHRNMLRSIIFCDTRAAEDTVEAAANRLDTANKVLKLGTVPIIAPMLAKLFAAASLGAKSGIVDQVKEVMKKTSPLAVAAALRGMAERGSSNDLLEQFDVPALVLCGAEDQITPPDEMREISRQLPQSTFALIEQAGHMSPIEQPDAVNAAIETFLTRIH